jgi:hypothetical protein
MRDCLLECGPEVWCARNFQEETRKVSDPECDQICPEIFELLVSYLNYLLEVWISIDRRGHRTS